MSKSKPESDVAYREARKQIDAFRELGTTELELSTLGLKALPPEIGQLTRLTRLDLSGNRLKVLPPEIGQLSALNFLNVSGNQLSVLPAEIGQLTSLTTLFLERNQLQVLPPEVGQLTALTTLFISNNQLNSLPPEIGKLRSLNTLNLDSNQLSKLPQELGQLTSLDLLDLRHNQLSTLPLELGRLSISLLLLASNRFREVPESVLKLSQLILLDLHSNQLEALPHGLNQLARLRILYLQDNQELQIPDDILGALWKSIAWSFPPEIDPPPQAAQTILNYYFRLQGDVRPLNEFKLILVGHGNVGKTALVNRLIRNEFSKTDMTRGIHIEPWTVKAGSDNVAAHVWDFGGQDIMHGTHQFFLTHRSLYLLVLSARESKQNDDAEYWLKTITAFGGNSPVIVVLNKSEERPFDVNENALRKKYPTIRGFVKTDCLSGIGIEDLQKAISAAVDQLDGLRDLFPAQWFDVKKRISGMKESFLTFEQFRKECSELGEATSNGQEDLAKVLHILGIALNFRDDERLRETSVLNPLWVTGGIYSLLNDNELAKRHGMLTLKDFARVLPDDLYPNDTHNFLRELMRKFELCFPIEGSKPVTFLIPELLGEQEPDAAGPLDTNDSLAFSYHYPRLIPHGLVPRLIVRLYQLIEDDLRWRTGAIFEWFDARALVKADEEDRCIRMRVHGNVKRSRELLAIIRQEFDVLHRQFHGLLPEEKVQLPEYPEVTVDYSHLEAAARAGLEVMPVFSDGNMIKVSPVEILKHFELPGEDRDAGNRGAFEVEPTPPKRISRLKSSKKGGTNRGKEDQ